MNPADGLYMLLPVTLAVPTDVPPEQSVGAEDCGPNTVTVIDPVGDAPADKVADTDEAEIGFPAVPEEGALTDRDGLAGVELTSSPWMLSELSS